MVFIFVVKQKTAYEMRISDWSSDVCSSDLVGDDEAVGNPRPRIAIVELEDKRFAGRCVRSLLQHQMGFSGPIRDGAFHHHPPGHVKASRIGGSCQKGRGHCCTGDELHDHVRSEGRRSGKSWFSPCRFTVWQKVSK